MTAKPSKVVVIGLDCAIPHLIQKHIDEGHLPTFKKLIDEGILANNCLVPFPTVTPPNWATIATGAWAGTHGITDFHVHEPGTDLDNMNIEEAFSSDRIRAETIWEAAEKAGKKSIVVNYPGSWPNKLKNGIVVGGEGLSIGENRDGYWGLDKRWYLSGSELVTTGIYPLSTRREFKEATEWSGTPHSEEDPLEIAFDLQFPLAKHQPADATWYVLAHAEGDDGYNRVTLSPTKNFEDAFCTLSQGQWSPKITTDVKMADGTTVQVFFRCKLLELSDDAEEFRLYIGEFCQTTGWSDPPEIAAEIVSEEGTFGHGGGIYGLTTEWFGLNTFAEINQQHDRWLGDVVCTLLKNHEWDIFYMHSHPPDWAYHAIITDMDPDLNPDEEKRKKAWDCHLKIYQSQDNMLAEILEQVPEDALVIVVSDHGATADGPPLNPYDVLVPAGLCAEPEPVDMNLTGYQKKALEGVSYAKKPDPAKSKAIPQRQIYVYVNLKGRDPGGIVEPEDYEKVQQEVIDALLTHVDSKTGKRPVALALSKQDARILGLYGDRVGDVVYALYPWFGSQHGVILPTASHGVGSIKGLFMMKGPGIKQGVRLERTIWLTDLVPTVCYAMNLPLPAQAEGAVVYQAFEDPNFRFNEDSG